LFVPESRWHIVGANAIVLGGLSAIAASLVAATAMLI